MLRPDGIRCELKDAVTDLDRTGDEVSSAISDLTEHEVSFWQQWRGLKARLEDFSEQYEELYDAHESLKEEHELLKLNASESGQLSRVQEQLDAIADNLREYRSGSSNSEAAPITAVGMLDLLDEFLSRLDKESSRVATVLSALRGPDNSEERGLKAGTTGPIRSAAFPKLHRRYCEDMAILTLDHSCKCWDMSPGYLTEDATFNWKTMPGHFGEHSMSAASVLLDIGLLNSDGSPPYLVSVRAREASDERD